VSSAQCHSYIVAIIPSNHDELSVLQSSRGTKVKTSRLVEDQITQFCAVTGASYASFPSFHLFTLHAANCIILFISDTFIIDTLLRTRDAKSYITKYKRIEVAIDAYLNNPNEFGTTPTVSRTKLNALFDQYKGLVQLHFHIN
jgi:hypothetical protein